MGTPNNKGLACCSLCCSLSSLWWFSLSLRSIVFHVVRVRERRRASDQPNPRGSAIQVEEPFQTGVPRTPVGRAQLPATGRHERRGTQKSCRGRVSKERTSY